MTQKMSFKAWRQKRKQMLTERKRLHQDYIDLMIKIENEPSLIEKKKMDQTLEEINQAIVALSMEFLTLRNQMLWKLVKTASLVLIVLYGLIFLAL